MTTINDVTLLTILGQLTKRVFAPPKKTKPSKDYPVQMPDKAERKFNHRCIMVAIAVNKFAKMHGLPYRTLGVRASDPRLRMLVDGNSTMKGAILAYLPGVPS